MRISDRLILPLAALALLAGACGNDDASSDAPDEGAEESADSTDDGDEAEEGDDGGEEHAEATFDGEELAFTGVSCGTLPADDDYEIRGRIDGGGHLQARFTYDPDASDGDDIVLASDAPRRLELFFNEGETIGDGRGFRADDADLEQLDASADHVAGSVHLAPEDDTKAPETHPEGAEVTFDLRCG